MPDFWEYPTVSMGLSPIMAIYQARFNRYLENRGLKPATDAKVWAFLGDGETDEPETLGRDHAARPAKARQPHFCHQLQSAAAGRPGARQRKNRPGTRSGFPRRRLERHQGDLGIGLGPPFRAGYRRPAGQAAWRNGRWRDAEAGSGIGRLCARARFWLAIRGCLQMVENYSDEQLRTLRLGGHDPRKVYAAYKAAVDHAARRP